MRIEVRAFIAATLAGLVVVGASFTLAKAITGQAGNSHIAALPSTSTEAGAEDSADLADQVITGGRYFQRSCEGCHGEDGKGGGGAPSLQNEDMSDADIYAIIHDGSSPMPSFAKIYTKKQINCIVAYIRGLSTNSVASNSAP